MTPASRYLRIGGNFPHAPPNRQHHPSLSVVVIGAGVAGIYAARRLRRHFEPGDIDVQILERAARVGGRVHTVRTADGAMEAGAGRVCIPGHRLVLRLIREHGLTLRAISDEPAYQQRNRRVLCSAANDRTRADHVRLVDMNVLSKPTLRRIQTALGYDAEFNVSHARGTFDSLCAPCRYATVQEGFGALCTRMLRAAVHDGIRVSLSTRVLAVRRDDAGKMQVRVLNPDGTCDDIRCDAVVACVPPSCLRVIDHTGAVPTAWLSRIYVRSIPLLRVYAKFPHKWWDDERRTFDGPIRYFIPVGSDRIVMVSYTDGALARRWHAAHRRSPRQAERAVRRLLASAFRTDVPRPEWVRFFYWDPGVHLTPPIDPHIGMSAREWSKRMAHPDPSIPMYLANEAYSHDHQQWVEGALRSARRAAAAVKRTAHAGRSSRMRCR